MNSNYVDPYYGYNGVTTTSLAGGLLVFSIVIWIISLIVSIFMIVSLWKIFKKLGKPGWAAIVPVYNLYVLCEIAEKPWWYLLLFLVPFANIYALFVLYNGISKKFDKKVGFTIGIMFLPFIFLPILAFSKNSVVIGEQTYNSVNNISNMNNNLNNMSTPVQDTTSYQAPSFDNNVGMQGVTSNETNLNNSYNDVNNISTMNDNLNNMSMQMQDTTTYQAPSFDNNVGMQSVTSNETGLNNSYNSINNISNMNNNLNNMSTPVQDTTTYQAPSFDNNVGMQSVTSNETGLNNESNAHTSLWQNNNQNNNQV